MDRGRNEVHPSQVKTHRGDQVNEETFEQKYPTKTRERKNMQYSDRSNNLPMVRTIQDQERDTYHPNISVDSHRVSVRNGCDKKLGKYKNLELLKEE